VTPAPIRHLLQFVDKAATIGEAGKGIAIGDFFRAHLLTNCILLGLQRTLLLEFEFKSGSHQPLEDEILHIEQTQ